MKDKPDMADIGFMINKPFARLIIIVIESSERLVSKVRMYCIVLHY